ncbi:uncharacterized protein LOC132700140 [Cylas formicarius]|uniref:uncharacterized protein LOC132700140 n=1 Tax=Cylas formicarius TaxID=197179 RepID=UPI00295869C7|nr:uncharacterized protein LOC132700140 [Cylas formicarius]
MVIIDLSNLSQTVAVVKKLNMSDVISKWIQHRMGIILDTSPDAFALKTANGRLLAELLRSYNIIGQEELKTIEDSDVIKQCYDNLKRIAVWLRHKFDIAIEEDEIYEIAHGVGTASMHLFYQVLLEVRERGALDFVADSLLTRWTESKIGRFKVRSVHRTEKTEPEESFDNALAAPLLSSGDVIHWYKDRLQSLQKRCLEAREVFLSSRERGTVVDDSRKRLGDSSGARPVTTEKSTERAKSLKNRDDFYAETISDFNRRTMVEKTRAVDEDLAEILTKQSDFEKRVVSKLGRIKHQKEILLDEKVAEDGRLNDLRASEVASAALMKDKAADESKVAYYLERERVARLHRQLREEKRRLKEEMREKMAADALNDMIDVAFKMAEYRRTYGRDLTEMETSALKTIFVAAQPIFDLVEPVGKIVDATTTIPVDVVADEIARQNVIDRVEFERYVAFEPPWSIGQFVRNSRDELDDVGRGLNVLGHLVHRVLEAKHTARRLKPPRLPHVPVRASVRGLNDVAAVSALRRSLHDVAVSVVEVDRVVEACVAAYVEEAEPSEKEVEEPRVADRPRKGAKRGHRGVAEEDAGPKHESKSVQTPAHFPSEDTRLSHCAQLGKTAYEVLTAGNHLTDYLVAAMLAEYLSSTPAPTRGWVLVNYPTDFAQASVMEETFTGVVVPDAARREECSICDDDDGDGAEVNSRTRSTLLPRPGDGEVAAGTFLTAYVKVVGQGEVTNDDDDPLDRFYAGCGVRHSFRCDAFNDDAATRLRNLILGESSTEDLKVPTEIPSVPERALESAPAIAGDPGWRYSTPTPPVELQIALATVWECVEEIYVEDLKQALFARRLMLNSVPRYVRFVKDRMAEVGTDPDPKLEYLRRFQTAFNNFDMDCRGDDDFKVEMHCRIEEFRERLSEMCDRSMMESEARRRALVESGWVRNLLRELMNVYVSMIQIEMGRFVETVRFVGDYFSGVFTKRARTRDSLKEELPFVKYAAIDGAVIDPSLKDVDREPDLAYFESELDGMVEKAKSHVKKCHVTSTNDIANVDTVKRAPSSRKRGKGVAAAADHDDVSIADNAAVMLEEWRRCVKGETARVSLRLDLLKRVAVRDIDKTIATVRDAYRAIFEDVRAEYATEMENVTYVCDAFASAVEATEPVDGQFEVRNARTVYVARERVREPKREAESACFTPAQLSRFVDVLLDLSPTGYMPSAAFTYLLQDVVWCQPSVPTPWSRLDAECLQKVIERLFGEGLEYVYWKDFVVHNLGYPGEEELMRAMVWFRKRDPEATLTVTERDFDGIKLWSGAEEVLRKVYRVPDRRAVKYQELLLDFCKDESVGAGFAKALALVIGERVCRDADVGRRYCAARQRILKTARGLVDRLVEDVVRDGNDAHSVDAVPDADSDDNVPDDASVAFFAPLDAVMTVVASAVRRDDGSIVEKATRIYERLRRPDFDGRVLSHELVTDDAFLELLAATKRFEAVDVTSAIRAAQATKK